MKILGFNAGMAERIGSRPYEVKRASSIGIAEGEGELHVYVVYLEPGRVIGPHEAGFGQLYFAASGDGWIAGGDGERIALAEGEAAFIQRGEIHSKGSQTGLTALMVQVRDLTALAR